MGSRGLHARRPAQVATCKAALARPLSGSTLESRARAPGARPALRVRTRQAGADDDDRLLALRDAAVGKRGGHAKVDVAVAAGNGWGLSRRAGSNRRGERRAWALPTHAFARNAASCQGAAAAGRGPAHVSRNSQAVVTSGLQRGWMRAAAASSDRYRVGSYRQRASTWLRTCGASRCLGIVNQGREGGAKQHTTELCDT